MNGVRSEEEIKGVGVEWHLNKSIYYKKQLVNGDKHEATYKKDSNSSRMFSSQK